MPDAQTRDIFGLVNFIALPAQYSNRKAGRMKVRAKTSVGEHRRIVSGYANRTQVDRAVGLDAYELQSSDSARRFFAYAPRFLYTATVRCAGRDLRK